MRFKAPSLALIDRIGSPEMEWISALLFIGIIGSIIGSILFYSYAYGITPTPTSFAVQKDLLSMLPEITNVEIVELGSGWGTLAMTLARRYPKCKVIAYEISPVPYLISKFLSRGCGYPNISIRREDFFQISLQNASLIVCYLYPKAMELLAHKFESELKEGAYVLSHTFAVPGWSPIRLERANDLYRTPIYLYQMKACLKKRTLGACSKSSIG